MKILSLSSVLLASALLTSCSLFGDKEVLDEPAELVKFDQEVKFDRLWSANIGDGQGKKYNRLKPAIDANNIYVAASDGVVRAFDLERGRRIWQNKTRYEISGGVGLGGDYLFIGTEDAYLIALDKNTGEQKWSVATSSEVLSVPASDGNQVIVQSVDGKLTAYEVDTGEQTWIYENTVPALTVRGTSSPRVVADSVLAGFANGMLVSIAISNGTLNWDTRIAIPTGRSELDRMIDVDGELHIDGATVLVPSLHGFLSMIDIASGRTLWRVPESSLVGVSTGFGNTYLSNERGHVQAYRRNSQDDEVWVNDQLDLREVSAPVSFGNYVAVGDFEGYLHLLSQVDGRFVGRIKIDGKGLRSITVRNGILYAFGNGGKLSALQVEAR